MLIPIFGSCPTHLNKSQDEARRILLGELGHAGLEWRSLGQTDYPTEFPLREVLMLARRCSGGLILGFSQFETAAGIWKKGTPFEDRQKAIIAFPTPWNHLEAGVLFSIGLPLLVFRDTCVSGGVFDNGVTDLFIHEMPKNKIAKTEKKSLREVFRKWAMKVQTRYYSDK
jgi:hypothetical protein